MFYNFRKGHQLHRNFKHDIIHYLEGLFIYCISRQYIYSEGPFMLLLIKTKYYVEVILPSIETIRLSIKHPEDFNVAQWKYHLCLVPSMISRVNTYASRVNIPGSWRIMHRESISMPYERSCIASQYLFIAEDYES